MDIPKSDKILNTNEPKIDIDDNGIDEIIISYYFSFCVMSLYIFVSIIFIWCPIAAYFILVRERYKDVIVIDKRRKTLILGSRGVMSCCNRCLFDRKTYNLYDIKNVKIQVTHKENPRVGFGKLYFINGYVYS